MIAFTSQQAIRGDLSGYPPSVHQLLKLIHHSRLTHIANSETWRCIQGVWRRR